MGGCDILVVKELKRYKMKICQTFEGYVIGVKEDSFVGIVREITDEGILDDLEIEVPIIKVGKKYRELIKEGAVFNWHIGDESEIIFNKQCWSADELAEGKKQAEKISKELNWC